MMVVRDITMIKQPDEIRRDFIANVSHELRTPYCYVGLSRMLDPELPPPAKVWQKAQQTMLNQSNRMASLVDQLLVLARIELDKSDFDKESMFPLCLMRFI